MGDVDGKMPSPEIDELLYVIVALVEQYMPTDDDELYEHRCMTAGECACDVLEKYGLAVDTGYHIKLDRSKADSLEKRVEERECRDSSQG